MTSCALPYDTLLDYTDGETARWRAWFAENPAALDVPFAEGRLATVRGVVIHIFAVELRYAERLHDHPVTSYDDIHVQTLDETFALHDRARALTRDYLAHATPESQQTRLTFMTLTAGEVSASKRKIASNIFLHGIRHWAQVASAVRHAGFSGNWGHDMLLTDVEL